MYTSFKYKDFDSMIIQIASGIGTGPTMLAAFDAALNANGIANYNLLRLSSVIPPQSNIVVRENSPVQDVPGKWGDRLYVVMAEIRVDTPGAEAWAGIGWVQDKETGKGLFVEHEGHSEAEVKQDIQESLRALMEIRGIDFGPIQMKVVGGTCNDRPLCAMTVAVYQSSDWDNKPSYIM